MTVRLILCDNVLIEKGFYLGRGKAMSSNVAEYAALILALKYLKKHGYFDKSILVRGDSKLVIKQMSGKWKIKKGLWGINSINLFFSAQNFSNI